MKPTAILVDLGLLAACCVCACWSVAPAAADGETPAKQEATTTAPAWADELIDIRRKLGGGALEGSLLDPAAKQPEQGDVEFVKELQRLWDQRPLSDIQPLVPSELYPFPQIPGAAEGDAALVASLRHTARLLDEKANRLETDERYENADRCRKLAKRLRLEARGFADLAE